MADGTKGFGLLRMRALWAALLLCLFFGGDSSKLVAEHSVMDLSKTGPKPLWECLHYRIEPGQLSLEDIRRRVFQGRCGKEPDFGFVQGDLWLRFDFENPSSAKSFWFYLRNSRIAEMDLYLIDEQQSLQTFADGYERPHSHHAAYMMSFPAFFLKFPAHSKTRLFVRLRSPFPLKVYPALGSEAAFHSFLSKRHFLLGLFYGIMGIAFLAMLLAFLFLRDSFLLWAVLVVFFHTAFLAGYDGFGFSFRRFLGLEAKSILLFSEASLSLANVAVNVLFARIVGLTQKKNPVLFWSLHASSILYFGISFLVAGALPLMRTVFYAVSIASFFVLIWILVYFLRQGLWYLRFLLLALLPNLIWIFWGFLSWRFETRAPVFADWMHLQVLYSYVMFVLAIFESLVNMRKTEDARLKEGIRQKTVELRLAKHRAEEASRHKEELMQMLSHDLRSPLLALKTSLPLAGSVAQKERESLLQKSKQTLDGLLRYIDYVLKTGKQEKENWELQMSYESLKELIAVLLDENQLLLKQKRIKLSIKILDVFWCVDKEFFLRVLGNLLDNAVKFSHSGSAIVMESMAEDHLVLRDAGVGISQERLDSFQKDGELFSTKGTQGEEGHGRGIAQVRRLMEIQGGRLYFEGVKQGGLIVHLEWPKEQVQIREGGQEVPQSLSRA